MEGFIVNFGGNFRAYVNHCVHAGTPLDWWPNEFFSDDRRTLICGTHHSEFDPATGKCIGGPCAGRALFALDVRVVAGRLIVTTSPDDIEA
jgi:nitrite reductase/ring-hydroxylating ferredoxin subunit